jgi:hypothetical protein
LRVERLEVRMFTYGGVGAQEAGQFSFFHHKHTLAIMTGVLKQEAVVTEFYWGDHRKHGLTERVSAEWAMVLDDFFRDRRDTHSAILLTALGIDALDRGCASAIPLAFFSEAMQHVRDLESRGPLSGDMAKIRAFLSQHLVSL